MSLVGVACGVYLAADKHRRARLAGVEVTPQNPLEAVLAQSGVEFPNLEAVLVRLMGDTPEARDAASIIVNHPDPAQLIREFAMRSTAPKPEEGSPSASSPTATPTPPPPAEPATATPPPHAPAGAPSAAEPPQPPAAPRPSVFTPPSAAPRPDHAPRPAGGAAYGPSHAPAAQAQGPGYAPQGAVFRPDYAPHPRNAPHAPMYRAGYDAPPPGAYRPEYAPSPPPRKIPPLPVVRPPKPHHVRAGGRFHPPPVPRLRPTSRSNPSAAAPSPSAPPSSAAPRRGAESSEPRTFLDWIKDRLAMLERAKEAELAETRRIIAANRGELAEVRRRIAAIEEARSSHPATATVIDVDPPAFGNADRVEPSTASVSESPVEAGAPVDAAIPSDTAEAQVVSDDAAAIDEHDTAPTSGASGASALVDADPDARLPAEGLKIEALHLRAADERDPDEPLLPTPVEMAEAARLFQLHEQRMRELDGIRRRELADHGEEIRQVKDICTALARVEAPQASPSAP